MNPLGPLQRQALIGEKRFRISTLRAPQLPQLPHPGLNLAHATSPYSSSSFPLSVFAWAVIHPPNPEKVLSGSGKVSQSVSGRGDGLLTAGGDVRLVGGQRQVRHVLQNPIANATAPSFMTAAHVCASYDLHYLWRCRRYALSRTCYLVDGPPDVPPSSGRHIP